MSRWLETIRVEQGQFWHLQRHQKRIATTIRHHYPQAAIPSLAHSLQLPTDARKGLWKCRVLYDHAIRQVTFSPYQRQAMHRLAIVPAPELRYPWKAADRTALEALKVRYPQADDLLIIQNGWLTDSTIANIVLEIKGQYYTPQTPLLAGTMRATLLAKGQIRQAPLRIASLFEATRLWLINALRPLLPSLAIELTNPPSCKDGTLWIEIC